MVEAVNKLMIPIIQAALPVLSFLAGASLHAEPLRDPTRPPVVLGLAQSGTVSTGPILQSVLISPQRRIAIISGQTVKLGGKFGDAHVFSISETEVVLRNGKGLKTLKLFPDVQKHLAASSVNTPGEPRRLPSKSGK